MSKNSQTPRVAACSRSSELPDGVQPRRIRRAPLVSIYYLLYLSTSQYRDCTSAGATGASTSAAVPEPDSTSRDEQALVSY